MFKPAVNDMNAGVYHSAACYVQTEMQTKLKKLCSVISSVTYFCTSSVKINFCLDPSGQSAAVSMEAKTC